jgi:hypothetical protein
VIVDIREQIENLRRAFVPPHELSGSLPRDVQLTAGGRALYAVAMTLFVVALAVGIGLHRAAIRQAENQQTFARDSVSANAQVTRLWRGSDDSKQPWVAYRFEASGRPYIGRAKVRLSRWRTLQTGSPLDVRYLPADPSQNVVIGAEPGVLPAWLPFLLAAAAGTGGVLCLVGLNRQRALLTDGRPAPALVTAVVKHQTSHGASRRSIRYTFPLLSGAIATGKSEAPRKAPAVGSVICVVYDPDRPRRSQPYPFALVRPARLR